MEKKVLFVATVATHIRGFHTPYLKLFKDNGYKTYVAANWNIQNEDKLKNCDKFIQIPIQRSPYKLDNLKAIKELKALIEKEKFDIIHCHTPMGAVVARIAAKKARKKYGTRVIYTAHGFHFYKGAPLKNWILFYPVEWYLAKYTDTLITINTEDFELAKSKFVRRCKNIEYVPGVGIDTKKFDIKMTNKEKKKLKESIGLHEDDFVLICVARLDRNKNQGFLIKCMEELVKDNNKIHLVLAGGDELDGVYQKKVDDLKLNDNVHFLGRRTDIPELLQISDIVLSASKREGLPVNIMEAMYKGLPIIAMDNRGHRELIKDGRNGFIIHNEKELRGRIIKLLNDNELKNMFRTNEKRQVKDYLIENVRNEMRKIYEKDAK